MQFGLPFSSYAATIKTGIGKSHDLDPKFFLIKIVLLRNSKATGIVSGCFLCNLIKATSIN
jgi:hypothetical protein